MAGLTVVILAAGLGTRMHSVVPKVLHSAAGQPLVYYPLALARELGGERVVVVVSPTTRAPIERVAATAVGGVEIATRVQDPPRGTGDAAAVGLAAVDTEHVLICCGDTPLLEVADLRRLLALVNARGGPGLAFLSCVLGDPTGYGRVLRDPSGEVVEIREHRDLASDAERAVREVNAGVYAGRTAAVRGALQRLTPDNAQGEYYLTDIVASLRGDPGVVALQGDPSALVGVNDRAQLRGVERTLWARRAEQLARDGVTIRGEVFVDTTVVVEADALLEVGVRLRGRTRVGAGAVIDVGCVLTDVEIAPGTRLSPYTVLTG